MLAPGLPLHTIMIRRSIGLLALLVLTAGCARSQAEAVNAPPPPPPVSVVAAMPERVQVPSEWIATLDGYVNAQIRPQVSGYLVRTHYRDGALVRKGQVLFEIDARPFEAVLAQARAQLARARADLGRAERDVARDTPLAKERAIPQSQLDNDVQAHLAAQAAVESAQAAVDTAELNVGFTKVRSLIDGVAAIATAQMGDLVGPATLLTTVSQVDPIRAFFSISEQEYLLVAAAINGPSPAAAPWDTGGPLTLRLADGSEYPRGGTFLAADREIDPRTGTIRISAAFPNPDRILRPGQYGRVRALTAVVDEALLVPERAIAELQGRAQLRIVDADRTVRLVTVTLGRRVGNRRIVTGGLEPGAQVVVDAPQLADGTLVTPHPWTPEAAVPEAGAQPAGGAPAAAPRTPGLED